MPLGADTQTQAHIPTHEQNQFQETKSISRNQVHAWFKKRVGITIKSSKETIRCMHGCTYPAGIVFA